MQNRINIDFPYPVRPIAAWPRVMTEERRFGAFKSTVAGTAYQLEYELEKLDAENVVIQLAVKASDIRLDGQMRANASPPAHPGVSVSFDGEKGPLSFCCDAFTKWEDNLRGIAKTLERLRMVDLYGVTNSGEQYRGWAALPEPVGEITTRALAVSFITSQSGIDVSKASPDVLREAYRKAAKKLHPDAGGDAVAFQKLVAAYGLLTE